MYRASSAVRKSSTSKATSQNKFVSKKQLPSDTVYLMQNQNQILKIKNLEVGNKVDALNLQLRQRTQRVAESQRDCQSLRQSINNSYFTQDIELQSKKKMFIDKIVLGKSNISIYNSKITDARKAVVQQQQKIGNLISERHSFEDQLRIIKMENQGSKKSLGNLQEEHQKLRQLNNTLSMKKYSYEPQQKVISQEIQERIRLIKGMNFNDKTFKKQKLFKLIPDLLNKIYTNNLKVSFLIVERHGLKKSLLKKKLFLMGCIRKKYLNFIKAKILSTLREPLDPLGQENRCVYIIADMKKRRQKAKLWRIWRNQTAKAQYSLIRKYECQTTVQKICSSMMRSMLIWSFNRLRLYKNSHCAAIGASAIFNVMGKAVNQNLFSLFSSLSQAQNKLQLDSQVQKSAEQHSKMLVQSKIFYEWLAYMKEKKKQSLSLKFKYFKRFKKIFVIKRRNVLSQMLGITKIKISDINLKSICFNALKQELYSIKDINIIEENDKVNATFLQLNQDTENRELYEVELNKRMALNKISRYLQKKEKEAFCIWHKQCKRIDHASKIGSILQFKIQQTVNYSFSRIQIKRFQKLKLSIKDKIASCDYSYNYLVQQNTHIKEVLDKKSHDLEKAKFVTIIKRLIRKEKQIKHQYFYKFLRNGFKCWKVKKTIQSIDQLMNKKIKLVFLFLLDQNKREGLYTQKIDRCIANHDQKQAYTLLKSSFDAFKFLRERNKRMRRSLTGVFDRNLQINFFQAFGKMRNESYEFEIKEITDVQLKIKSNINEANENIESTESQIQTLTQRLKNKQQTFRERKTMSLYKFFLKSVTSKVGSYIWRWKNKIDEQKRIVKFVNILDVKTESMIKMKFLLALQKTKGELQKKDLQNRLQKYKHQYQNASSEFDKFVAQSEEKTAKMKVENQANEQITIQFLKRTDHMNNIKVESFLKYWSKNVCKFVFRQWKIQTAELKEKWNRVFYLLDTHGIRIGFQKLTQETRFQLVKDRIRQNLSRIYHKNYKSNVGIMFRIWRNVNILNKVKQHENQLKKAMKGMEHIQNHYEMVKTKYYSEVDYRIHTQKLRKITNAWRIYTEMKMKNRRKQEELNKWLFIGYSVDCINVLRRNQIKSLSLKNKILSFQTNVINRKALGFLKHLYDVRVKKHTIQDLFMNKFVFYQTDKLNEEIFMRIKNYYRQKQILSKDKRTFNIQKVINCFEKKRKDILCNNMRLWKRNMYLITIEKNLMKRVVKNSMNSRVKDLFYAWKLEKEARFMVRQHTEEGEVKKRKVQIQRLKKFLDDYKKEKGLLLQNEEGNFVVSPRFQENKQRQIKRENVLKYKFISRVILAMNGYQAPAKAWNNLSMFMKLRVKCKKAALVVKNRMEKADLYTAFKTWQKGVRQFKKLFQEMERKDLIRILNKQKDKMEIQYSKKMQVQQKVQTQLRRYKVYSYQQKRKQRISAQILFKQARKVKDYAFKVWRKRVEEMKNQEEYQLEQRGNQKVLEREQQVQQMQAREQELQEHNRMLKQAVKEALQLAEMIKRIGQQRDCLKRELTQNNISCENLQEQNEQLSNKLVLAQKEAMNLLVLSGKRI